MKRFFLIILSVILMIPAASAQDTTWYYGTDFSILKDDGEAQFKRDVKVRNKRKNVIKTYELKDKEWELIRKEKITQVSDSVQQVRRRGDKLLPDRLARKFSIDKNGLYQFREYKGPQLTLQGTATSLVPLHLQDTVRSFYESGQTKSIAIYNNNSLVSNQNWLKNGSPYIADIFHFVEQEPQYSRGQAHFRAHMMTGLKESGIDLSQISDKVVIGYVVMEDGSLEGFHVISGVFKPLNEKIIELIRTLPGEWVPAKVNGRNVRYYMTLPFNFIDRTRNFESLEMSTGFVVWD